MTPTKPSSDRESLLRIHLVQRPELVISEESRDLFVPRGSGTWWALHPGPTWVMTRTGERVRVPVIEYRLAEHAHPILFALQQFLEAASTVPFQMYSDLRASRPQVHAYAVLGETGLVEPLKLGIGVALA